MIIPEMLRLSQANYLSNFTADIQQVEFNATYINQTFTKDNLKVKFVNVNFTLDPFYPFEVLINNRKAQVTRIVLTASATLDYVLFKCDANCKNQVQIFVQLRGFRNAPIKNSKALTNPAILYFVELLAIPNRVYTSNLTIIPAYHSNLVLPSGLLNVDTKVFNYDLGANNNSIEILFSMSNNPSIDSNAQVTFQLPKGMSQPKSTTDQLPKCSKMFTNASLNCEISPDGLTFRVTNYFKEGIQSSRRRLQSYNQTSTYYQNTVIGIKLSNITNPSSQAIVNQTITIQVIFASGKDSTVLYGSDSTSSVISSGVQLTNQCQNDSCAKCFLSDPSFCVECKKPSLAPLLQGYQCQERCGRGYFEYNFQCYKCPYGCKECQTFDQCLTCDESTQILVDGQCLDRVNRYSQPLQCPDGTSLVSDTSSIGGCQRKQECAQIDCAVCGADKDFCLQCNPGKVVLNGKCQDQCPYGYTLNKYKKCLKCDSLCEECETDPRTCKSCRFSFYQQVILDLTKSQCSSQCSDGSLLRTNDPYYCDACGPQCNTCSGSKDRCTSCDYHKQTLVDLYLYQNQCLEQCPYGYLTNQETKTCDISFYQFASSSAPAYLVISLITALFIIIISKIVSKRRDDSMSIFLALLCQIEFINRMILIIYLWGTDQVVNFTFTGSNLMVACLFGIYFTVNVMQPLCNQMKNFLPVESRLFSFLITLSQISGVNTMRLVTTKMFGLPQLSAMKLYEIPYYIRNLETITMIESVSNMCQILIGINCTLQNPNESAIFGYGLNSVLFNLALIALQTVKYAQFSLFMKVYKQITAAEPRTQSRQ